MESPSTLLELYSGDDLSTLFKGGFINFGFWDESVLEKGTITEKCMIDASGALYQQVLQKSLIQPTTRALEVGSGHGSGCALVDALFSPKSLTGVDYLQTHVNCSIQRQQALVNQGRISYLQGQAESLPIPDESVDLVYTLEAFQHFRVRESLAEFARVLVPNGILLISTFFALKTEYWPDILQLLPRPAVLPNESDESDSALPQVMQVLDLSGFENIETYSIGHHVWYGYDKWVKQNEPGIWDTNWLRAYEQGLIDYYIIKATRK